MTWRFLQSLPGDAVVFPTGARPRRRGHGDGGTGIRQRGDVVGRANASEYWRAWRDYSPATRARPGGRIEARTGEAYNSRFSGPLSYARWFNPGVICGRLNDWRCPSCRTHGTTPRSGHANLDSTTWHDGIELARPKRFELLTPRFVVWCSIQLSYGRVRPVL